MVQLPEARDLAPRLATGAFILNSGLTKLRADQATAEAVHGMACVAYPFLDRIPAERFTRLLACSELAVGGALLAPFVPTRLAGLALTGFSGGLFGLYLRVPGMRQEEVCGRPRTASRWPRTPGCWASGSDSWARPDGGGGPRRPGTGTRCTADGATGDGAGTERRKGLVPAVKGTGQRARCRRTARTAAAQPAPVIPARRRTSRPVRSCG